eukprot:sb/3466604/
MDNVFATMSDPETVTSSGSDFARYALKPLTITMCVLGLISSLILVVTIFARCRRWTNLPITSTLYLHICALNIMVCLYIFFLIPIWNAGIVVQSFFVIIINVLAMARPALLLSIYLFRLLCIVRPSSIFNRDEVQRHRLKTLTWCIWIGALVVSVIMQVCYVKKFCGVKVDYARLFMVILYIFLQAMIIVVSVAMVAYLSVLYRRFSYNHSEVTPLLDGGNAALLENIALTLRIVCSTLLVDLFCFSFAMVVNVENFIWSINPDIIPAIYLRLYHWLGSQPLLWYTFFLLPMAIYATLISCVLILVHASMRQALWGVVKRVARRFCGRDNEE